MPAGYILKQHLETFKEFPPRQAPPDFNPGKLLEQILKTAASGVER
jgi:arylsulfatase